MPNHSGFTVGAAAPQAQPEPEPEPEHGGPGAAEPVRRAGEESGSAAALRVVRAAKTRRLLPLCCGLSAEAASKLRFRQQRPATVLQK